MRALVAQIMNLIYIDSVTEPEIMKNRSFETNAIHYSKEFGEHGAMNVAIYQNSTFAQKDPGVWEPYTYTRTNNPTEEALRCTLAGLEGGSHGVAFSSGLGAINAMMELLNPGDHVVSMSDIYGGTHRLFSRFVEKRGISFTYVDTTDEVLVKAAIKPNTKLIFLETPSNPLLKITDLAAISAIAKSAGALFAVDNTMATPYGQRPIEFGADIVMHSTSKYISGHTNVIGGMLVVKDVALYDELRFIHKATGANPAPFDCYLTMLGLKTLGVRMRQHCENAQYLAEYLREHTLVDEVFYPGLSEHPQHELAKRQMNCFGGIVSFTLKVDENRAKEFIRKLEIFSVAISFGSVASLVDYPALMSHKEMPKEERRERGFADTLIRISVGIEDKQDLLADLNSAFGTI
jgi:cystathionine beta-lyase/cystathionine gamma-synthase